MTKSPQNTYESHYLGTIGNYHYYIEFVVDKEVMDIEDYRILQVNYKEFLEERYPIVFAPEVIELKARHYIMNRDTLGSMVGDNN